MPGGTRRRVEVEIRFHELPRRNSTRPALATSGILTVWAVPIAATAPISPTSVKKTVPLLCVAAWFGMVGRATAGSASARSGMLDANTANGSSVSRRFRVTGRRRYESEHLLSRSDPKLLWISSHTRADDWAANAAVVTAVACAMRPMSPY